MNEHVKYVVDGAAAGITISTFIDLLPEVAAGLSVLWTLLRIYEWFENRWKQKHANKQ